MLFVFGFGFFSFRRMRSQGKYLLRKLVNKLFVFTSPQSIVVKFSSSKKKIVKLSK